MQQQNIICSNTHPDGCTHEQIIICAQSIAGHVEGSWPLQRKKKMHGMTRDTRIRAQNGSKQFSIISKNI